MNNCMPFQNVVIHFISGTGNALKGSMWFAEEANAKGINCSIHRIDKNYKVNTSEIHSDTLLGFAFPTHGFNAAPAMIRFIANFPKANGQKAFIINTRAGGVFFKWCTPGLSGMAQILPICILKLKGYKIVGSFPLDLPSNWISMHPGYGKSWVDKITNQCEKKTRDFARTILDSKKDLKGLFTLLPIDLALIPITIGYTFFGRYFLSKTFIYNSSCNGCGVCASNCPVEAITMKDKRPFWTHRCESCMRCINCCPSKSIETSHLIAAISIGIYYLCASLVQNYLNTTYLINTTLSWLASLLGIYLLYALIHPLLKIKTVNNIFTLTSLTHFWKRYLAKGIKPSDFNRY